VAAVGLNLWAVAVALPFALSGPQGALGWLMTPLPLFVLTLGLLLPHERRRGSTWTLMMAYPLAVGAVVAGMPQVVTDPPHGTLGLLAAVLALWAYAGVAGPITGAPEATRSSTQRPLGAVPPVYEPSRRRRLRRLLLSVAGLGGLLLAVVAPTVGGHAPLQRAYGPAADAAGVLAAVVGGAIGASMIALFIAPATRASKRRPPPKGQLALRLSLLVLVVVTGVFLLYLIGREESA
jgi:hypothetical protein